MKISIITVNYNDKIGLEKTIQSVLNQENVQFEYLVIDGNSSDGSKDVIEKYKDKINYWVSEPDSGIYNAMNKGIRAATGDYLLFLNSGDWLFENTAIATVDKLINGTKDIYYGNAIFKFDKKDKIVKYDERISFQFFTHNSFCHQATFIKKQLFHDIFMYNENLKIVSDWEFFIYAICIKNVSHQHINVIVANYDLQGISSRPEFEELKLKERAFVFNKYFSMFIGDYENLNELNSKRIVSVLNIKKHKYAWKIFKAIISLFELFLPKQKTKN
ncbi:glycosyltransferase family 2 protein [Flavobacterium sp. SUN052]|uniref:glycosyltransferase family 2 protein n=1 Tax=Flavobacterium sp. SUN052 TaxID=3002441 RepID=UPI00237E4F5A|nr:glycosyltransferase family 2 protein [Flavobacterium sp. SUN052]MEC4005362.1 glycosyltransferase family 2 protein [Flavobacterium sp. SUN052]